MLVVSCAGGAACYSRQAPQAAQAAAAGGAAWQGPAPVPRGSYEGLLAPGKPPVFGNLPDCIL